MARRWVMSLAVDEIPTTAPARFTIGDIVTDTASVCPSLATRTVSDGATRPPSMIATMLADSASRRSGGTISQIAAPIASSAL